MAKEKLVPIEDVAGVLRVAELTLCRWIIDGRLILRVGKDRAGVKKIFITEDSIREAYKVKCIHCGKTFKARGPKRARYCSIRCRNAYQFHQRKLGLLPRKTRGRWRRPF